MRLLVLLFAQILAVKAFTQVVESFTDGDFSNNPAWFGTPADFIVNNSKELQTNANIAGTSYLSTPHLLSNLNDVEWRFRVRQSFSPSGSNFGRIYLTAQGSDPLVNPDGYYLQLGEAGSSDAIRLFKQESGNSALICSGTAGAIASSFHVGIQVKRSATGTWSLACDASGGTTYVFQQSGTDVSNLLGTHLIWQSTYTASNAQKFYLDDIYVGPEIIDQKAPVLLEVVALSSTALKLRFDEALDTASAINVSNYELQPTLGIIDAELSISEPFSVELSLNSPLSNATNYFSFAKNIADLAGNDSLSQSKSFYYFVSEQVMPGDVIINEFMCDPSPAFGLPEHEYVEIYNRSNKYFDTKSWRLADASSSGTIQGGVLAPDSFLLLVPTSALADYPVAIGVTSFPSLNNNGDQLILMDSLGIVLDELAYTDAWYNDEQKSDGGYSIERIQPHVKCSNSSNWKASVSVSGGTPVAQNSVYSNSPDLEAPKLQSLEWLGKDALKLSWNEHLDSTSWMQAVITFEPSLSILNRSISQDPHEQTLLQFTTEVVPSQDYQMTIQGLKDCENNSQTSLISFIYGEDVKRGDLVVNEILFDPISGGYDYVELANTSQKVLQMKGLSMGTLVDDSLYLFPSLNEDLLVRPGEFLVLTENKANIIQNFPVNESKAFYQTDLPSFNNDSGTVIVAWNDTVLDQVSYNKDWHFELLDSKEGKALERLNYHLSSNDPNNWHTAAETVYFGSPGLPNSQRIEVNPHSHFTISNPLLSPDNDGWEDLLVLDYALDQTENLLHVTIYDLFGREIIKLANNLLVGSKGTLTWDGLNSIKQKVSIGHYIVLCEAFRLDGTVYQKQKLAIVVAGKI
jgi:hypothetical protein